MASQSNKLNLADLDVVYPVKPTRDGNSELRYSLRSLRNLPHRNVHIFSDYIIWLDEHKVKRHPSSDRPDKQRFANVNQTLLRACDDPNISDPFIFMNDDFFVMKPVKEIPYYVNGTLQQHYDYLHRTYQGSKYMRDLLETQSELKRLGLGTLDFEVHAPIIFYKDELRRILKAYPNAACRRTLYANSMKVKWKQAIDFKIYGFGDNFDHNRPFVSTADANFRRQSGVRSMIRSEFTTPSPYEK